MKRLLAVSLMIIVAMSIMMTGCQATQTTGSADTSSAAAESAAAAATTEKAAESAVATEAAAAENFTILIVPKLLGVPYYNRSEEFALAAGKELGVNVIFTAPTEADAAQQVLVIEDYLSQGVDAIAVAPNDADALTPVLERAKEAGVLVMDWDSQADQNVIDYSIRTLDDTQYGQHIWDLLAEQMGDSGQYAVITGGLDAENLNAWINAGLEYAKTAYPNLELVCDVVGSDEDQQVAYTKALDLIKTYPDLKGIIGISTPAPLGIALAVQEKGLQDKIAVVGTSLPNDSATYLADGSLDVATLWDPGTLGALTVYIATYKLQGKEITDGMDIPGIGNIKLNGKIIIMGDAVDFTKDNVADYGF